jgi:hypothetical protein
MTVCMSKVICRFCGKRATRAKEHAWPQWLLKTTELSDAFTRETHAGIGGAVVDQRVQSFDSMQDGHVCATCNNTWMSELENAAKPIIEKIAASGSLHVLTHDEAPCLALWAFKTAIARNAVSNYRKIVPASHYKYLYANRAVAPRVYVDAAICPTHKGLSGLQSQTLAGLVKHGGAAQSVLSAGLYNVVLAVESLLMRVIYFASQGYEVLPAPDAAARVLRLHPRTSWSDSSTETYTDYRDFALDAYFVVSTDQEGHQ